MPVRPLVCRQLPQHWIFLQSEEEGGQKALADTFGALNEFADYNTAFTDLQAGALDALAIDVGVAKYQLNSRGEGFKILDETLNTEQYAIGFKKVIQNSVTCECRPSGTCK